MCGITGIVAFEGRDLPTADQLGAMCDSLYHRGPDEEGKDTQKGVAMGMRRLSIIDVRGGYQPFFNEDRTVRAIFNGEIYNFRELRDQLQGHGHRFSSETDGEVLVHLWEEYGTDFATHLNGMFAIALHDMRQNRFLLVRDRLGIKPLFYYATSSYLVFGSEIKALLASGLVERQLDLDALGQFLAWEYVPAPQTLFSGVCKLQPATMLEIDLDHRSMRSWEWWELPRAGVSRPGNSLPQTPGEWEEAVDAKIRECVQRQLISDVPLGAFLSGGVDSSSVVSAMGRAQTFSIGFEDPSYNETEWSKKVAQYLGVKHTVEIIQPRAGDLFENLMKFMDDPIGDFSIFPTYLISRLARKEVTVALTGDGGDEVFGGYETYIAQEKARMWERIPCFLRKGLAEKIIEKLKPRPQKKGLINKAKRFVEGLQHEEALTHTRWRLFVGEALRRQLFTRHAQKELKTPVAQHILDLAANGNGRSELDRSLYVDLKSYLADNCLVKVDRMSMACSLEVRVPLLDHELVELAFCMPENLKVHRGKTKVLLKRVAAKHVPRECVYRAKEGFSIPIKNWLQSQFRPMLEDLLASDKLKKEGIFRVDTVERMKTEHMKGLANHSHILWSLMVFQDWRRRWRV